MFKAVDALDGGEVIILDRLAEDELEAIRRKARDGHLRCPVCTHEVTVRAGEVRVWHFAHKHLDNCPSQNEPVELLQARAMLYRWLKQRFGDGVTVEKQLEGIPLPRPVDCWVEAEGNKLAYWIVHRRMRPEDRQQVEDGIETAGAKRLILFLSGVMDRHEGCDQHILHLSTTERQFLRLTGYDLLSPARRHNEGSLHYLDIKTEILMTFRAMHCMEPPNYYVGTEIRAPFGEVKVSPTSGQFYHGDERERYVAYKAEQERLERERRERERLEQERLARGQAEAKLRQDEMWGQARERTCPSPARSMSVQSPDPIATEPAPPAPTWMSKPQQPAAPVESNRVGVCEECGQETTDWWMFDGKTGKCRCNDCARKRRASAGSR